MEPKFKVGDFIKHYKYNSKFKVIAVTSNNYVLSGVKDDDECLFEIGFVEDNYILQPKEIKITRKDLAEAWDEVTLDTLFISSKDSTLFKKLVNKLGL